MKSVQIREYRKYWIQENTDQKKSVFGHFLRSAYFEIIFWLVQNTKSMHDSKLFITGLSIICAYPTDDVRKIYFFPRKVCDVISPFLHSYAIWMHSYFILIPFICTCMKFLCFFYVICMPLVCIRKPVVCHWHVRMYSYVIPMPLVCTHMLFVCTLFYP